MAGIFFFDQTKYSEVPINTYKVVHIGPKIQLGGEKNGLFRVEYQVSPPAGGEETVKKEPMIPAKRQMPIEKISFGYLITICYTPHS